MKYSSMGYELVHLWLALLILSLCVHFPIMICPPQHPALGCTAGRAHVYFLCDKPLTNALFIQLLGFQ